MTLAPSQAADRTRNPLRPSKLVDVVGQEKAKRLMARAIESCYEHVRPLDHVLLVGPSGTGKSTFSHVIANELGVDCYDIEAPVSYETIVKLRTRMRNGDILKMEEVHQQAIMERRGKSTAMQPEVLYSVMEDRVLQTQSGPVEFPAITIIGTTTDEGMLPEAFLNRFPLRPRLEAYTVEDMFVIGTHNAAVLDLAVSEDALWIFARASRGTPREMNNLMKNALVLTPFGQLCDEARALDTLEVNGIEPDGLTADMAGMLRFLYTRAKRRSAGGEIRYQASVNSIATALGKSRDTKAIALRVEPHLITSGLVQVLHGGRALTDDGIARARELVA